MTVIETDLLQLAYPPRLDLGPQLTHEQLMSSMQATMARHKGGPVWLFAYGSLIWRPECSSTERVRARVHGYHRGLYLWSHEHRGTPELPGLVFGLDRGGSCSGFAYRLPEDQLEASLYALWQREMPYPLTGRTGSAADCKMAVPCRRWGLCWSGICPAMPATCPISCLTMYCKALAGVTAPLAIMSSRP